MVPPHAPGGVSAGLRQPEGPEIAQFPDAAGRHHRRRGGVMSASLAAMLAGKLVPELAAPMPGWVVAMGFLVPVIVGIFFGTRPAMRVANLAPVEALRYG